MKDFEYITIRVGLKFVVLFKDEFIDNDGVKTYNYLKHFLQVLYDDEFYDIDLKFHEFN